MTEEEFAEWRKNKLLYGMHWRRLVDRNTKELLKYNETAVKYINGEVPQIFASGYNDVAEQVPTSPVAGFDFELVNADTVSNLVHEEGITLPKKVLDPEKDVAWNAKLINAQLLQGILQGESIPEMAKRMQTVANSDLAGATRTARTMHTAAQNYGRQTGYNKAAKQGIIFEKTWLSANQEKRTRDSHRALNGQTVAYDKRFKSPVTDVELMFPGDWNAVGRNIGADIYNCRCTMTTQFKGFMTLKEAEKVKNQEPQHGWKPEDYTWLRPETKEQSEAEKADEETAVPVVVETADNSLMQFDPNDYTEQAKENAARFEYRGKADALHRPYLDSIWDTLTIDEKYAIYEYTRGSNGFNMPVAGYDWINSKDLAWSSSQYKGIYADWSKANGKKHVPWEFYDAGAQSGEDVTQFQTAIVNLTNAIEKSSLPQNTWLKRTTDINALGSMFGKDGDFVKQVFGTNHADLIRTAIVGKQVTYDSFMSTGISEDTDDFGDYVFFIYAPKGTKAIYAEPQSHFGGTARNRPYVAGEDYGGFVKSEAEIIVQRGTTFRITSYEKAKEGKYEDRYVIKMEIIEQPDYFEYGDEDTLNNGATRHKIK